MTKPYKIIAHRVENEQVVGSIEIDKNHHVFNGHFPQHPVLPGVCLLDIVTDLLNLHFNKRYKLSKAATIKFLKVVDPNVNAHLRMEVKSDGQLSLSVSATSYLEDESVHFKFKGSFIQ